MAPSDTELSRSFLAMLHTKEEKIRKLSERLSVQQQKLSQAEANAQHEMRDLLSTNRKLYLRMEEMRKEYHRVAADNVELRLALSRRDEVLAESRALMNDLQTRLKEREEHRTASASPGKRLEEKAAAKREAGAVHGTPHGERGVFHELTRPARVFGRKADRAAEARGALRELYVKRGEARDAEGGGENLLGEVGGVEKKQAWEEEGVGDWQADVEEKVGGWQEEEVGGGQLLEEEEVGGSQLKETVTVKEKWVTDESNAARRRERINVCAPSEKVPLSQTRPKRNAAPLSMVEPQLGTKLRQGDAHTFGTPPRSARGRRRCGTSDEASALCAAASPSSAGSESSRAERPSRLPVRRASLGGGERKIPSGEQSVHLPTEAQPKESRWKATLAAQRSALAGLRV